ncbi:MAG: hypothetical protein N3A65_05285 [candidate division WOR-3 bacterium]|nr:hypothetical protein [candidate division WOR-3 bacterium]
MFFIFIFSMYYIDQPAIIVPTHGDYYIQLRFGPAGEIIGYGSVDLLDRISLGLSYGASNLIGAGNPGFYKLPGIQVRLLALEQMLWIPAVVCGFDNQGYGRYHDSTSRYDIMSKGLFIQVGSSLEYPDLMIVPSIGVNYSFEQGGRIDIYSGVKFKIGSTEFMLDYSPNLGDEKDQNKGYLNTGIRLIFYNQLFFEFALRDLLDNSSENQQLNRMIKIGYQAAF